MRDTGDSCEEVAPGKADFWGLFGVDTEGNAYAIGDFSEKSDAEFIRDAIQAS
jgi:hypothetical protein